MPFEPFENSPSEKVFLSSCGNLFYSHVSDKVANLNIWAFPIHTASAYQQKSMKLIK